MHPTQDRHRKDIRVGCSTSIGAPTSRGSTFESLIGSRCFKGSRCIVDGCACGQRDRRRLSGGKRARPRCGIRGPRIARPHSVCTSPSNNSGPLYSTAEIELEAVNPLTALAVLLSTSWCTRGEELGQNAQSSCFESTKLSRALVICTAPLNTATRR